MTRRSAIAVGTGLLLAVCPGRTASAETMGPARLARTLVMVQDQIVLGSGAALGSLDELKRRLAMEIGQAQNTVWKDPQQVRALAVHLLNGGSPRPIRLLVDNQVDLGGLRPVILALLAFAERRKDAAEQLATIDARSLDAGIAGHFALTQAISSSANPELAKPFIALAKLLAPGSIVEEAAVRRELEILAAAGKRLEAGQMAARYLWRFGSSLYAKGVVSYLANSVIPDLADRQDGRTVAAAVVNEMPPQSRVETLLAVARNAVLLGKMEIASFAARSALAVVASDSAEKNRVELYAAIAEAFVRPGNVAADGLKTISQHGLSREDAAVLEASLLALNQIRAPVRALPAMDAPSTERIDAAARTIKNAQALLDQDPP